MSAATYCGQNIAARQEKLTISPSVASKDRSGLECHRELSRNV